MSYETGKMIRRLRLKACLIGLAISLVAISSPATRAAHSEGRLTGGKESSLRFEVVSIRPSGASGDAGIKILPDEYQAKGMPLEETILIAYFSAPYFKHRDELKGFPSWVGDDAYDIVAKVAPEDVARWQALNQNMMTTSAVLQEMLRSLLAERCKLRIHSNESIADGYVLTLDKKNRLEVQSGEVPSGKGMPLPDGGKAIASMQDGRQVWTFYNTSMRALADFLQLSGEGPVEDKTSLPDKYHFVLVHLDSGVTDAGNTEDTLSPFPWDLKKVGLRVNRGKVKSLVWVVDSIGRPSPN